MKCNNCNYVFRGYKPWCPECGRDFTDEDIYENYPSEEAFQRDYFAWKKEQDELEAQERRKEEASKRRKKQIIGSIGTAIVGGIITGLTGCPIDTNPYNDDGFSS